MIARRVEEHKIKTPAELIALLPPKDCSVVEGWNQQIRDILDGKDKRKLIVTGPCSIHNTDEGLEYACELKKLSDDVNDKLLIVMRAYVEKPRTNIGWTGLAYDPELDGSYDLETGLKTSRQFMLDVVKVGLPIATEFLGPEVYKYLEDLVSFATIGARTTESQPHRHFASGLPMPVGFKNATSGDISAAVNAAMAAKNIHIYVGSNLDGQICRMSTKGNPYTFVVLRGGNGLPNCRPELIEETYQLQRKAGIPENIIVDCSHGNSLKKYEKQEEVSYMVLDQMLNKSEGIKGIMLEANINEGKQSFPKTAEARANLQRGVSITDGCINLGTQKRIVQTYYGRL